MDSKLKLVYWLLAGHVVTVSQLNEETTANLRILAIHSWRAGLELPARNPNQLGTLAELGVVMRSPYVGTRRSSSDPSTLGCGNFGGRSHRSFDALLGTESWDTLQNPAVVLVWALSEEECLSVNDPLVAKIYRMQYLGVAVHLSACHAPSATPRFGREASKQSSVVSRPRSPS